MKPRTRTYIATGTGPKDASEYVRCVVCTETYRDSQHWRVEIVPEGYGSNPEPLVFAKKSEWGVEQEEGYGTFRPEYAFALARLLTGNNHYSETE